ncbi:MAG: hypothetical protein AB7G93_10015 [Bdellovibrionales bacterium]
MAPNKRHFDSFFNYTEYSRFNPDVSYRYNQRDYDWIVTINYKSQPIATFSGESRLTDKLGDPVDMAPQVIYALDKNLKHSRNRRELMVALNQLKRLDKEGQLLFLR